MRFSLLASAAMLIAAPAFAQPMVGTNSRQMWLTDPQFGAYGDGQSHPLSARFATLAAAQAVYPLATSLTDESDGRALEKAIKLALSSPTFGTTIHVPCGVLLTSNTLPTINKSMINVESECPGWGRPQLQGAPTTWAAGYEFGTAIKYVGPPTSAPVWTISPDDDHVNGHFLSHDNIDSILVDANKLAGECFRIKSVWYSDWNIGCNEPNSIGFHFDTANLRSVNNVQWNRMNLAGMTTQAGVTLMVADGTGNVYKSDGTTAAPGDFSNNQIGAMYFTCPVNSTGVRWAFADHNTVHDQAVHRTDTATGYPNTCIANDFIGSTVAADPNGYKPSRYNVIEHFAGGTYSVARGLDSGYDLPSHDNEIDDINGGTVPIIEKGATLFYGFDKHTQVGVGTGVAIIGRSLPDVQREEQAYFDELYAGTSLTSLTVVSWNNKHIRLRNIDTVVLPFADTSQVNVNDTVEDTLGCVAPGTTVAGVGNNAVTISQNLLTSPNSVCNLKALRAGSDIFIFHGTLQLTTNADITPTEWDISFPNNGTDRHLTIAPANVPAGYPQGVNMGGGTSNSNVLNGQTSIGCAPTADGLPGHGSVLTLCGRSQAPAPQPAAGNVQLYQNTATATVQIQDETNKVRDIATSTRLRGSGSGAAQTIQLTTDGATPGAANCYNVKAGELRSFDAWLAITSTTNPLNWATYKLSGAELDRTGNQATTHLGGTLTQTGGGGTGASNGLGAVIAADTVNGCLDAHFVTPAGNAGTYAATLKIFGAEAP